jgi:hypothetical protein
LGTDVPRIAIATEPFGPTASFATSGPAAAAVVEAIKLLPPAPPLSTGVALVNTTDHLLFSLNVTSKPQLGHATSRGARLF